ncbi:MAG: hypothetical protein KGH64_02350 [Candidatus Micrarchaeota archaeon]|nr:hypothetical protein [Candidatus Micrarchaeota archaeon]MDE1834157.1 hypothetical protein [Candidatus Micrarchaeota archaeon]MDE1859005.1 hypothetical protein [Candidatus Micrarchaeota archaeon]
MIGQFPIQIGVLIIVALVYAVFDVFNKRNVPDILVYATVVIGLIIALVYNYNTIYLDLLIAVIIALVGFVIYKMGFLGGGDVLELVFVSLVLPVQSMAPYYTSSPQLNIPFVLSVIIAAGYTALIFMPIYYILVKRIFAGMKLQKPEKKSVMMAVTLLIAYLAFAYIFTYAYGVKLVSVALVVVLAVSSFVTILFEKDIYNGMTKMLYPSQLELGDMLALNLMKESEIKFFKGKYRGFGRLATTEALKALKGVKRKLPVYRDSVPFSLFILFGVLISLAFGNIVLVLIGI